MRIKRLFALAICLIVVCMSLIGCEEEIGSYLEHYNYKPEKVANMEFDLYIVDGGSDARAKKTVNERINQYLSDEFKARVNIKYISSVDEYEALIRSEVIANSKEGAEYVYDVNNQRVNVGKILLVTDADLMADLMDADLLYDLNSFVYDDQYNEYFGKLKTLISEDLMNAAKTVNGELYAIPNNHVVDNYEYLLFHRDTILKLNIDDTRDSDLRKITSLEGAENIITKIANASLPYNKADRLTGKTYYVDPVSGDCSLVDADGTKTAVAEAPETLIDLVTVYEGAYEEQKAFIENGFVCNIARFPEPTAEEAFSSAFAIIAEDEVYYAADSDNDKTLSEAELKKKELVASREQVAMRAMQIVNALNSDETLRNYLQYGIENINYKVETFEDASGKEFKIVEHIVGEGVNYYMPLEYTGNIFNAYFCVEDNDKVDVWNYEMYLNGQNQNKKVNYYKDIYLKDDFKD